MKPQRSPTGVERFFGDDEIIVSKTDARGVITYANRVFLRIAGYEEHEVLGRPHSIIRHPDMPRCVFKLLWDTIQSGEEIFAYVVNLAKNGDHYWVLAHVTPTFDAQGRITGYHSSRRVPRPGVLDKVRPLYANLLATEQRYDNKIEGMQASSKVLMSQLEEAGVSYGEFVFSL
ncbi:MAG TPA: PAS domain S-box protein [Planctomycetes bacterium]|nr:PAS domain S-box protein [Planctomycetota bacterium]